MQPPSPPAARKADGVISCACFFFFLSNHGLELGGWVSGWLAGWLACRPAGWLAGWLAGWVSLSLSSRRPLACKPFVCFCACLGLSIMPYNDAYRPKPSTFLLALGYTLKS